MKKIVIEQVNAWYGTQHTLKNINMSIEEQSIVAFIGPSGCGKTTLLKSINRLNDLVPSFRIEGQIRIDELDIYGLKKGRGVEALRKGIGMVFQQPNPLPDTIMKNMLLPLKEHYHLPKREYEDLACEKLIQAGLFEEVKDRLHKNALTLSGGQQQRLCIARALMLNPQILLFDEPCSALDPVSTLLIEDLLTKLKASYTILMVTHNMEQAARIADATAFFYLGEMLEYGATEELFTRPQNEILAKYMKGSI